MTTTSTPAPSKRAPEPVWRGVLTLLVVAAAVVFGLPPFVEWQFGAVASEATGLTIVLIFGFLGLAARGYGELRGSPGLKAAGYFLGAIAAAFTTSFAWTGSLPLIGS